MYFTVLVLFFDFKFIFKIFRNKRAKARILKGFCSFVNKKDVVAATVEIIELSGFSAAKTGFVDVVCGS